LGGIVQPGTSNSTPIFTTAGASFLILLLCGVTRMPAVKRPKRHRPPRREARPVEIDRRFPLSNGKRDP
jgi:hypothetical protein